MTDFRRQRLARSGGPENIKTPELGGAFFSPSPTCVSEGSIDTPSKSKDLRQKAVKGVAWTALQRYSTMLIQFVSAVAISMAYRS